MLKIENIKNFNLDDIVNCGEIFRYEKELDGSYTIILKDRVINVKHESNTLYIESNNYDNLDNVIKDYFDLNRDYSIINNDLLKKDKTLKEIISSCAGFRLINSYPFETIISYIISANNNVIRIKKSVDMVSERYGTKITFNEKEYFLFPTPMQLKNVSVEEYRECRVGFRDKYIKSIVSAINDNPTYLNEINNLSTLDAYKFLLNEKGIGPKVASCILLFAYQRLDVYPIDTWVKKFMKNKYNIDKEKNIREFTSSLYKEYSGIAIQYMFNYERNKKIK